MATAATKLDTREARTDLTSRECSKLIGGSIGCLMTMAPRKNIRDAVIWWAEHFDEAFPEKVFGAKD